MSLSEYNKREIEKEKKRQQQEKEKRDHPGMERYQDPDDFWAEAEEAKKESKN